MSQSISQRKVGYLLIASGGSLLVALVLYAALNSAGANFRLPKFSDDNITVSSSTHGGYRWVTRDEEPDKGYIIVVAGDGEWHDSGIPCLDGEHYRVAPSGDFQPFDVNLCGSIFSVSHPLPDEGVLEAYAIAQNRFNGVPQTPIVLFSPGGTIRVRAGSEEQTSIYLETSNAQGKKNVVPSRQAIENNFGRPQGITGTEFQKVPMPPRWPMQEFFLCSYYLFLPAGQWVDTGIRINQGNHILIKNEGRFYPFQYQVGMRTFGPLTKPLKEGQFLESYSVPDGTPLGDRKALVAPGSDTVKIKVSHDMDMRVEVYQAWAQQ